MQTILACTRFSSCGQNVAEAALNIAERSNSELLLLNTEKVPAMKVPALVHNDGFPEDDVSVFPEDFITHMSAKK